MTQSVKVWVAWWAIIDVDNDQGVFLSEAEAKQFIVEGLAAAAEVDDSGLTLDDSDEFEDRLYETLDATLSYDYSEVTLQFPIGKEHE